MTLHTGDGTDTDAEVYWGMGTAVWNGGDTGYAYDGAGQLTFEYQY